MLDVIHEAGWPIFFVLAFGATGLLLSVRHAIKPERRNVPLIVGLGVITLLWGLAGTSIGLQYSISGVRGAPPESRWLVWVGLGEALNNFSAAALAAIATAIFTTIGVARQRD